MNSTKNQALLAHVASGKALTQRERVYQVLSENLPMTRNELAESTGLRLSSLCGRINELITRGLVVVAGARRCRITDSTCQLVAVASDSQKFRDYEKQCVINAGVKL